MRRLNRLVRELRRRSVWQVLAAYAVTCWVVYQVVLGLYEGLGLPDWVVPTAVALLLVGLPVVFATALVQEGGGARRDGGVGTDVAGLDDFELLEADDGGAADDEAAPGPDAVTTNEDGSDVAPVDADAPGRLRRIFTWPRAITAGVLAFALLGVATTGFMGLRALGIGPMGSLVGQGVLEERERVIVAEFESPTGDSVLAAVVGDAFRVGLAQSRLFRVVDRAELERIVALMERSPEARLDASLAREVAIRDGIKAVVAGRIAAIGGRYVVTAELVAAENGRRLVAFDETAGDSTEIIDAVDRLADRLREKAGESLRTIRSGEPLARVTTSSLSALRQFSLARAAINRGDCEIGTSLLDEAIALDSTFAMAYRRLASAYTNPNCRSDRARQIWALRKALEHGDRLTDRERYHTTGLFHSLTGRPQEAVSAFEALLELYPDDATAANNLGVAYRLLGRFRAAADAFGRAIELGTTFHGSYANRVHVLLSAGDLDAAERALDAFARRHPDAPGTSGLRPILVWLRGDHEAAIRMLEALAGNATTGAPARARTVERLARFAAIRGRLGEAERRFTDLERLRRELGDPSGALAATAEIASIEAWVLDARERAIDRLRGARERYPLDAMRPPNRPYIPLAIAYAAAGDSAEARRLLAERDAEVDELVRRADGDVVGLVAGIIALREGRPVDAAAYLEEAERDGAVCADCLQAVIGRARDELGRLDEAIVAYERFLTAPAPERFRHYAHDLGFTYERLGELYELKGDTALAVEYYARFVELWADADPALRTRVEAARRAVDRLAGEGEPVAMGGVGDRRIDGAVHGRFDRRGRATGV